MSELEILGFQASTFVRTACLAAAEKEAPYTLTDIFPGAEELAGLSPTRKTPAMRVGDVVLFETLGICAYIDKTFEGRALFPTDSNDRIQALMWSSFCIDALYHTVARKVIVPYFVYGEKGPNKARIRAGTKWGIPYMAGVERRLSESSYLAGNSVSVADLFLYPVVDYIKDLPEAEVLFWPHRSLVSWFERMSDRPSVDRVLPKAA